MQIVGVMNSADRRIRRLDRMSRTGNYVAIEKRTREEEQKKAVSKAHALCCGYRPDISPPFSIFPFALSSFFRLFFFSLSCVRMQAHPTLGHSHDNAMLPRPSRLSDIVATK